MLTPLERRKQNSLSIYDPNRTIPMNRPAPTSRTASQPAGPSWTPPAGASRIAQAAALSRANQQQKEEEQGGNPFGRGLGFLINNPVTQTALKPLEVLDYGRRAVTLGLEEFAEGVTGQELKAMEGDTRSNMDKLKDPTYGVGQLLGDTVGEMLPGDSFDEWGNRIAGLAGDIALDPLSWLSAGVGGVVGKGGRAGYAATARATAREAGEKVLKETGDAALAAAERARWVKASDTIGRYGPGVIKDKDILEKIGLQGQALRIGRPMHPGQGLRIGGDTKVGEALGEVARKSNQAVAKVRAGFYDTKVGNTMASWRAPSSIAKAQRVIRGSADGAENMPPEVALAMVTYHEGDRMGSKAFRNQLAPAYEHLSGKHGGERAVEAMQAAERPGITTEWNLYADEIRKIAKDYGLEIPERQNWAPHIITNDGMDLLRGDEELRKLTGVTITHLDDPSGVTMPRKLTAGEHVIQGKKVDFGTGTVDEANRAMKNAFGIDKFYEDDITTAYSKYMNRLSSDIGTITGLTRVSEMFPELLADAENPGDLLRLFHDVIDEGATEVANKTALGELQTRLSRVNTEIGAFEDAAASNVEDARQILAGEAGEHLDRIKSMRTETKQRLRELGTREKSLVKQRDTMVRELDKEMEYLDGEIVRLRREITDLKTAEMNTLDAINNVDMSVEVRRRSQERATRMSQVRRQMESEAALLEADRDLLNAVNRRIGNASVKEELISSRLGSKAPTPRPLEGLPPNYEGPRPPARTVGDSYVQLAGGDAAADQGYIHIGEAEQAYLDAVASGEWDELNQVEQNILAGRAERERLANINQVDIIDEGISTKIEGGTPRTDEQIRDDFRQRKKDVYAADAAAQQGRKPAEIADATMSPQERARITNAERLRVEHKGKLDTFFESDAGERWLADRAQVEDVSHLRTKKNRYKPRQDTVDGQLTLERRAAESRVENLREQRLAEREGIFGDVNRDTASARKVAESQVTLRQSQINASKKRIEEISQSTRFKETRRVSGGGKLREDLVGTNVGPSSGHRAAMDAERAKIAAWEQEIADINERLAVLDSPRNVKTTSSAEWRARISEAEAEAERLRKAEQVVRRRTDKKAKEIADRVNKMEGHRKLVDSARREKLGSMLPPTDQSHLELSKRLAALERDEAEALGRAAAEREALTVNTRDLRLRTEPVLGSGRLRLPRTKAEIEHDLKVLNDTAHVNFRMPKDEKQAAAVQTAAMAFPYDKGSKGPVEVAKRVLDATETARPYRQLLVHSGAISMEEAAEHNVMFNELKGALARLSQPEGNTMVAFQEVVEASDRLRRANEFLGRYGKMIDDGAQPSDALAARVTREIVDNDIGRLNRTIDMLKKNPGKYIDQEAEHIVEAMQDQVFALSAAYSDRRHATAVFNQVTMSPQQEVASLEARLANNDTLIDWAKGSLRKNRGRRTRGLNNGNEKLVKNAERAIANNEKSLEEALATKARIEARVAELQGGALSLSQEAIIQQIDELAGGVITPQTEAMLAQLFTGSDMPRERLLRWLEIRRQRELHPEYAAQFPELTSWSDEFYDFVDDVLGAAGLDFNESMAPLEQLKQAAKIQAKKDVDEQRQLFSEIFDSLGFRRIGDQSKEASIGYRTATDTFSPDILRKKVREALEKNRGMTDYEYALRDLESRRDRLTTVNRGLGKRGKAGTEIVGRDPSTGLPYREAVSRERLPKIEGNIEEALKAPPGKERMSKVAAAQRTQGFTADVREQRIANIGNAGEPLPSTGLPAVSWREAVFGHGTHARSTRAVTAPAGEQRARGLSAVRTDIPHPSAALTRQSPSAQSRVLQDELKKIVDAEAGLQGQLDQSRQAQKQLAPIKAEAESSVAQREAKLAELQGEVDSTVGTPLIPEQESARNAAQEFYDERIGTREEKLGQLETKRAAFEKGQDKAMSEIAPELTSVRQTIREVGEVLNGPSPGPIEMPPVGGFAPDLEYGGAADMNRLALPAAGESEASKSLNKKLEEAQAIAKQTQKNVVGAGLEVGGPAAVAAQFDTVMADMGLPYAETMMVRALMGEAVGLDQGADILKRGAAALENAIGQAKNNQLKTVTRGELLRTWKPMAEELFQGMDETTRFYMADTMARYFTRFDEAISSNRFWKAVEAYTNFFKTYATMRPDFHVRNGMSAMFMNSSDGVPIAYNFHALNAWKRFRKDPDFISNLRRDADKMSDWAGLTNGQLADAFDAAGGSGAGGQFAERGVSSSRHKISNNRFTRLSKKAGEYVEGPVRLAVAMDSIKQGKSKWEALTRITRLHFDYAEVSNFDQVAKRFIPFWTFMSRNLPLQVTQMVSKPKWYAWYNSFQRNFQAEGDPLAPDYWVENGGFALPSPNPIQKILGTEDQIWLMPDLQHMRLGADLQDWSDTLSMKNASALTNALPLFTAPLEAAMGKDMFTGRQYGPDDVRKLGGLEKGLEPLLDMLGMSENGYVEEKYMQGGRALIPTWDQLARLMPSVVTGDQSDMDVQRRGETYARRLGLPIRQLTEAQKQAQARSQYYDAMDEQRRQQAISGR